MGKPHKFAWNGIDVETTLTVEQLANMAQRAAQECTGDLMHGKHRIVSVASRERQIEFRINDFLISFKKFMVFRLEFQVRDGRTWMSSRIEWYVTTQPTVGGFIPVAAKTMVGHHTYMQFVRHLASQVQRADPQARITIREGVAVSGAAAGTPPSTSAPTPVATPSAGAGAVGAAPTPPFVPQPMPLPAAAVSPSVVTSAGASLPPPPPPLAASARVAAPPPPPAVAPPPPAPVRAAPTASPSHADPTGVRRSAVAVPSGLVTSVPGMPKREPEQPHRPREFVPSGYASVAEQLFAEDEGLFHTRMVQQGVAAMPWVLRLQGAADRPLDRAVVLGRNPALPPGAGGAAPVPVDDPHRSVSKTHALIELRDGLPWVTDLHSTNGTTLTNDVGEALICEAGVPVPVGDGWTVGLGEYPIMIIRRAS